MADDTFPFASVPPHLPVMPVGSVRGRAPHCLAAGQHPVLDPFYPGTLTLFQKALLMCSEERMTTNKCLFIFAVCFSMTPFSLWHVPHGAPIWVWVIISTSVPRGPGPTCPQKGSKGQVSQSQQASMSPPPRLTQQHAFLAHVK